MPRWSEPVLVTGAGGFLGSRLVAALSEQGAEVHGLLRAEADLRDAAAIRAAVEGVRPRLVFSLAAGAGHPEDADGQTAFLADTVLGTQNLLEALRAVGIDRVVHTGSSFEYGPSQRPMRETDPPAPTTFRGVAKAAATELVLESGLPATVVRPFSVYGPGEQSHRFVPAVVSAALRGEPILLTRPGIARDFVFVDDVVEALLLAAQTPEAEGEIVNAGTGRQTTNEELVATLGTVLGRELDVRPGEFEARPWDTDSWVADTAKAERLLGWTARTTLAEGLAQTVAAAKVPA
jgi:nucleoside-diphosphate-sugar epimerase